MNIFNNFLFLIFWTLDFPLVSILTLSEFYVVKRPGRIRYKVLTCPAQPSKTEFVTVKSS